jgi:hypothetical protein
VRTWLGPEAISKLKFASKNEIQTFIGPEYLPPHMGGTVCTCSIQLTEDGNDAIYLPGYIYFHLTII